MDIYSHLLRSNKFRVAWNGLNYCGYVEATSHLEVRAPLLKPHLRPWLSDNNHSHRSSFAYLPASKPNSAVPFFFC